MENSVQIYFWTEDLVRSNHSIMIVNKIECHPDDETMSNFGGSSAALGTHHKLRLRN